jgi:hypothetical protein
MGHAKPCFDMDFWDAEAGFMEHGQGVMHLHADLEQPFEIRL